MARRKHRELRPRVRRSVEDLLNGVQADLTTLEALAASYDGGHYAAAGVMASVIHNIVEAKSPEVIQARGALIFPTPRFRIDQRDLTATNRLVALQTSFSANIGCHASFLPWGLNRDDRPDFQKFRVWWSSEPIYVEGAGGPPNQLSSIPLSDAEILDWDDRAKVTRQQFIVDLRNAIGSHADKDIPAILADLRNHRSYAMQPAIGLPGGSIGTIDTGDVTLHAGPAEAMARQIAEEVLMAYGRRDLQKWPTRAAIPLGG